MIWLVHREYSKVVTGLMLEDRPVVCGGLCMFVVSRGDMWWVCGGVFDPLATCVDRHNTATYPACGQHVQVQPMLTDALVHASTHAQQSATCVDDNLCCKQNRLSSSYHMPIAKYSQYNVFDCGQFGGSSWTCGRLCLTLPVPAGPVNQGYPF